MPLMQGAVTVHMAAPAEKIWDLVADIRNTGKFSPETFDAEWLDGATGPALGAKFRGHVKRNEIGPIYWTTCRVTACEPASEFGFAVLLGNRAVNTWHYRFVSGVLLAGWLGFVVIMVSALLADARGETGTDMLVGSSQALFLGPTFIPDPAIFPGYEDTVDKLYLEPLGFPANGTIDTLVTPESPDFGPSIQQGVSDLVNAVEADYTNGTIGPGDPLTIVTYSQSTVIASLAEPILAKDNIPSADLDFVMLGDAAAPTGILSSPLGEAVDNLLGWSYLNGVTTPDNLYPTDVVVEPGDFWADTSADTTIGELIEGFFSHGDYMGVTEQVVQAALANGVADGMTTTYTLDPTPLIETLLTTALNDIGL
jgi:hypothetical protein